jgi:hypothetical protein
VIESVPPPIEQCTIDPSPPDGYGGEQFTYEDVARFKRVTKQTVMEWVKRGMVPSPVYTGFTARFTTDQVATIMVGTSAPGTFPVTLSPRALIAKQARDQAEAEAKAEAEARAKKKKKKPSTKKPATTSDYNGKKSKPAKSKQSKGARS